MNPLSDLIGCETIAQVKEVRKKYIELIPTHLKWRFENTVQHSMTRIRRIENEKKESWKLINN